MRGIKSLANIYLLPLMEKVVNHPKNVAKGTLVEYDKDLIELLLEFEEEVRELSQAIQAYKGGVELWSRVVPQDDTDVVERVSIIEHVNDEIGDCGTTLTRLALAFKEQNRVKKKNDIL